MSLKERIRIISETVLAKNWAMLKSTTLSYRRNNGEWQEQKRETYDRGHGAAILLYNLQRRTVIRKRPVTPALFGVGGWD